jgi:hypothetical protein
VENGIPAYAVGYNAFEAKVPAQKPGIVVAFTVRAIDKDGNVGFGHGTYSIAAIPDGSNSSVEPPPKPESSGGMPLETAVIAIVVVAIAGFGALYYIRKRRSSMPPPSAAPPPPQIPV